MISSKQLSNLLFFINFYAILLSCCQGHSQKKIMTEAMYMVKFSYYVFRVFMMTSFKQKRKK